MGIQDQVDKSSIGVYLGPNEVKEHKHMKCLKRPLWEIPGSNPRTEYYNNVMQSE